MRSPRKSEQRIIDFLVAFERVYCGMFEVTSTQLEKGLVDANETIRDSFAASGIHNYSNQDRGPHGRRHIDASVITADALRSTRISLYRPSTKGGDPRLWIHGFRRLIPLVRAGDLIVIAQDGVRVLVLDVSTLDLTEELRERVTSSFGV